MKLVQLTDEDIDRIARRMMLRTIDAAMVSPDEMAVVVGALGLMIAVKYLDRGRRARLQLLAEEAIVETVQRRSEEG